MSVLQAGFSSRSSAVYDAPENTNSGWRRADSFDEDEIEIVNIGDYIIDSPNIGPNVNYPNGAIDVRPSFLNLFTLEPGQKLVIIGDLYDYINIENNLINGEEWETRCPITNYNGQLITFGMAITGATYFRLTGKYVPGQLNGPGGDATGDSGFLGKDEDYNYSSGKFGIWIKRQWRNIDQFLLTVGGNVASGASNFYEIDNCEFSDGGFSIGLKWDSPPSDQNEPVTHEFHDNFVHDIGGEGLYDGRNSNNGSHTFVNSKVYNNRFVRTYNEINQYGNFGPGCDIYRNVLVHGSLAFKSPFEPFQNFGVQLVTNRGVVKFRDNILVGCAELYMSLGNANRINVPDPDVPVAGMDIEIDNNAFYCSKSSGIYIFGGSNDSTTGWKIRNNSFFYLARNSDLPANLRYSSVYPWVGESTYIINCAPNQAVPIEITGNEYQQGMTLINGAGANVTQSGNVAKPNPELPKFISDSFGSGRTAFDYWNLTKWSAFIGEASGFPANIGGNATAKGQPNVYNAGHRCMHKSLMYESRVDGNTNHEPQGFTDAYWLLKTFNGGGVQPDNYTLDPTDTDNGKGRGLLDNPAPTFDDIVIELGTLTLAGLEPTVYDPTELTLYASEGGSNTIKLRIDYAANALITGTRCGGMGSSTLDGSGQTDPFKVKTQLKTYFTSIGGDFYSHSVPGLDSRTFVLDGTYTPQTDPHRNVLATLCLEPDVVVISVPSNDPGNGLSNAEWINNLEVIFDACAEVGVICLIASPQPRTSYVIALQQQLYDMLQLLLAHPKLGPYVFDVFTPHALPYSPSQPAVIDPAFVTSPPDGIHLNNAGATSWVNIFKAKLQEVMVNKNYLKLQVERSLSPDSGYTLYMDDVSPTAGEILVPRTGPETWYYRIRAQKADTSFTSYSAPSSFTQPFYAGDVVELTQLNLSESTHAVADPGWFVILPVSDIPSPQEFTGILDSTGIATGYVFEIVSGFQSVRTTGGRAGEFPLNVIRSNWRIDTTVKPVIKIKNLDPNAYYNIKILGSTSASGDYRFTGINSGIRRLAKPTNDPVNSSNDGDTMDFLSMRPEPDGSITFICRALATAQIAYINAMQIEKLLPNNGVPIDRGQLILGGLEPLVIGGSSITGLVKLNLTSALLSGLEGWNDLNVQASHTFQDLLTDDNNNSGLTLLIENLETAVADNGTSYGGSTVDVDEWPAEVCRITPYKSGNPGMKFTVGNCSPSKLYDITIFGTRNGNTTVDRFTQNGVTQDLSVFNNKDTEVTFSGLTCDVNGKILVTSAWLSGGSGFYTYITAIKINIRLTDSSIPIELGSLVLTGLEPEVVDSVIPIELGTLTLVGLEPTVVEEGSPGQWITVNYYSTYMAYLYIPANYQDGNLRKAAVWLSGAGPVGGGTTVNNLLSEGLPFMIDRGDRMDEQWFAIAPHRAGISDWDDVNNGGGLTLGERARQWLMTNYGAYIDQGSTGFMSLSLGCVIKHALRYPSTVAWVISCSGSQALASAWANITNVAVMSLHGTADGTQTEQNSIRVMYNNSNNTGMNVLSPAPKYPPIVQMFWNLGHNYQVWHNRFLYRKDSPVAPVAGKATAKASWNWTDWGAKFNTDASKAAEGHVIYAEKYIGITDWLAAKYLVDLLPAGAVKTDLTSRLLVVRNLIATKMYVVDFGSGTYLSPAPINNMTNINNGQSISNILEYFTGATSTISNAIISRFSTYLPQTELSLHYDADYWRLGKNFNRDGARCLVSITTGQARFSGLDNTKKYKLLAFYAMANNDDTAQESEFRLIINGVTKTGYAQYNTFNYIEFDEITPTAGAIDYYPGASKARDCVFSGVILLEKP